MSTTEKNIVDKNNNLVKDDYSSFSDIDISKILKKILQKKKLLLLCILIFAILGIFKILITPNEYTSQVVIYPETQQIARSSSFSGIARQLGISTTNQNQNDLSPTIYPKIARSNEFLRELIYNEINTNTTDSSVTIKLYLTDIQKLSIQYVIRKYTLGLPKTIYSVLFQSYTEIQSNDNIPRLEQKLESILILTKIEESAIKEINSKFNISTDQYTGLINVTVNMPEPLIAAQVANHITNLLKQKVTEYRTDKAQNNLMFVEKQFEDAKQLFEKSQNDLAIFRDQNRGNLTSLAQTQEQKLLSEFNLSFNVYNTLAEQLIQAQIRLQEDTPILTIIDNPIIPSSKSSPNRFKLFIMFSILGGLIGIALIFGMPYVKYYTDEIKS